jgi:hypothetical protein
LELERINKSEELAVRDKIQELEEVMRNIPGAMVGDCCPLIHSFAKGLYVRQITMPANMLFVTKIHKFSHAAFILSGDVTIMEEDGPRRINHPCYFITKAGTKRIVFTHEETVWVTVHCTEKTDITEIEDEIIAKNFSDIDDIIINVEIKEAL